jgi:hypothetical protein
MRCSRLQAFLAAAFLCVTTLPSARAQTFSSQELQTRLVARRAVDAVIWGTCLQAFEFV